MKQNENHFPEELRHSKKLITMYKIHNNLKIVPDYLKRFFPSTRGAFQFTMHVTQVIIQYQNVDCKI